MSKISLQMYTVREYTKTLADLETSVGRLADIGFDTLQYTVNRSFDAKEVKRIFDSNKMANDSVFCRVLDLEERQKEVLEECALFGTDHIRIDNIPAVLADSATGYKAYAHMLNELAQPYKKQGMKLLYHFHAFEFIRFGDLTGIEIILKETDPEVIGLNPDTHWIQSGGRSVCSFLEQYKDRYDYIHTKDFAITKNGPTLEARPIEFAPVGEGNLEWQPIIDLCKKNGVKVFAIEQDACYGRDPFACAAASFHNLKKFGADKE